MTLNQAIKTLNIEGRRLTVPSVRKLTGIKSDTVIRAAIDKLKADLSRKEKEKEEKSQMNVKCAEIVVRWRKNRTWGSTCTAEAKVKTENEEWHHYTSPVVSGCGYDKHSQALSYVFNAFFKGMIWRLTPAKVRRRAEKWGDTTRRTVMISGQESRLLSASATMAATGREPSGRVPIWRPWNFWVARCGIPTARTTSTSGQ